MSLLNALKSGLDIDKLTIIGSGDIVKDIIDDFVKQLQLNPKISDLLEDHFEKQSFRTMNSYSSYVAAQNIPIPVLVIHDENDPEVPVSCAHHIKKYLENGELLLTQHLGHQKILGDTSVISKTIQFITT